jgi:hypothetical protein
MYCLYVRNAELHLLQVQIPKPLYRDLKKKATKKGETLSAYVRRLLDGGL